MLEELRNARSALDSAERALRDAVEAAYDGGVPIATIAREIGATRPTVYRWLHESRREL